MRKIKVNVTQRDINKAIEILKDKSKFPSKHCPIALSLHRHKDFKEAKVFNCVIKSGNFIVSIPTKVIPWIRTFDNGRFDKIKPFSFTLEVPNER